MCHKVTPSQELNNSEKFHQSCRLSLIFGFYGYVTHSFGTFSLRVNLPPLPVVSINGQRDPRFNSDFYLSGSPTTYEEILTKNQK